VYVAAVPADDVVVATNWLGRVVGVGLAVGVGLVVVEVVEEEEEAELAGRVVVVAWVCDELCDLWFPTMANAPNTTTTATTTITPVPGRLRWFMESRAIRWARSARAGVVGSAPPGRPRSTGRASSKTIGASGSGNSSVPRTGMGGTTRSVIPD
jgi:hypothetical protein